MSARRTKFEPSTGVAQTVVVSFWCNSGPKLARTSQLMCSWWFLLPAFAFLRYGLEFCKRVHFDFMLKQGCKLI